MLTPGAQVIVEIGQTEPQKKVERTALISALKKVRQHFRASVLGTAGGYPSAQRNIDIEPTGFGCGYRRESSTNIGAALASRTDDMARRKRFVAITRIPWIASRSCRPASRLPVATG
jgi:hypothetical protein